MRARNYILTHWRGQQSLSRTVLVNGLILYLSLVVALVASSSVINAYVGLAVFLFWFLWAVVGIFRCGLRYVLNPSLGSPKRIGGIVAILGLIAVAGVTAHDAYRLGLFH